MHSSKIIALVASSCLAFMGSACPIIERDVIEAEYGALEARQETCRFDYAQKGADWAAKCGTPICGNGRQQSPINFPGVGSYATVRKPTFAFPGGAVVGEIFNRGFGSEWKHKSGTPPTIRFSNAVSGSGQDVTYNLLQWHTHTPESEHAFNGNKKLAEIHFVFGTGSTPRAVAGIGMEYGQESRFFGQLFQQLEQQGKRLPTVGQTNKTDIRMDFSGILSSNHFRDYYTYNGSLTTPGCGQNIRWFLGGWTHVMSGGQFPKLYEASIDSVRALQPTNPEHRVNL